MGKWSNLPNMFQLAAQELYLQNYWAVMRRNTHEVYASQSTFLKLDFLKFPEHCNGTWAVWRSISFDFLLNMEILLSFSVYLSVHVGQGLQALRDQRMGFSSILNWLRGYAPSVSSAASFYPSSGIVGSKSTAAVPLSLNKFSTAGGMCFNFFFPHQNPMKNHRFYHSKFT